METETSTEVLIDIDCFDRICRICLCELKEDVQFNINDLLIRKTENPTEETEMFVISDILTKYISLEVSIEVCIKIHSKLFLLFV